MPKKTVGTSVTSLRLTKTIQDALRDASYLERKSKTTIVHEALEARLKLSTTSHTQSPERAKAGSKGPPIYPYPPEDREWHEKLHTILSDPSERPGIEANLRWGADAVSAKQQHPTPQAKREAS